MSNPAPAPSPAPAPAPVPTVSVPTGPTKLADVDFLPVSALAITILGTFYVLQALAVTVARMLYSKMYVGQAEPASQVFYRKVEQF